jgi:hypothetical protein
MSCNQKPAGTSFHQYFIFIMAILDQEDKGKTENSKESFITNLISPLFACFLRNCFNVTLLPRLSNSVKLSNKVYKMFCDTALNVSG